MNSMDRSTAVVNAPHWRRRTFCGLSLLLTAALSLPLASRADGCPGDFNLRFIARIDIDPVVGRIEILTILACARIKHAHEQTYCSSPRSISRKVGRRPALASLPCI